MADDTNRVSCVKKEHSDSLSDVNEDAQYVVDIQTSHTGTTGTFAAVFIVVNAAMGAGLLNIPDGLRLAGGIGPGVALEMSFLVFIIGSLLILGYCAHTRGCVTYQEVIENLCGKLVGVLCEICIILYMYGTSIAMIIIVGDQFDKVMEAIVGPDFCLHWYCNRKFTMCVFSILVIFPLCIPKDIGFLRHASVVGVIATIIVMITVVVKYALGSYTPTNMSYAPKNASNFLAAIPTIFFAYQCHVSSIPVYSSLRKKTATNWLIIIVAAVFICALSYTLTGICGYLSFGDDVKSDVLQSYDAKDASIIVARVAIVIAMLTSYPIVHFCGRAALFTLLIKLRMFDADPVAGREKNRRYAVTAIWFVSSLVLALFIPNIGEAIAVVGGLAGCFILLFPGLCLFWLSYELDVSKRFFYFLLSIAIFYTVLGTFLFGEITTEAIMNDIYHSDSELSSDCYAT